MKELEKKLGHEFVNAGLLKIALTHSSYANEHRCKSYERMELLGDSVLSIIVSEYLFEHKKDIDEGELSRIRASLVCEESLAETAKTIDLGKYIFLGNGEERSGSRNRASILSDVFEATLAALYLDGGMDTARSYLIGIMGEKLRDAACHKTEKDYKSRLQEVVQQKYHGRTRIEYITVEESGPEHKKCFLVELIINGSKVTEGKGFSKKEAEQLAAKKALSGKKL